MSAGKGKYDAAIIGGGPAGVSCAVWLARLGLAPVLVEASESIGGLCRRNPCVDEWNASLPAMTGPEVADNLASSLAQAAVPTHLSCAVEGVSLVADGFVVAGIGLAEPLRARYLVLA